MMFETLRKGCGYGKIFEQQGPGGLGRVLWQIWLLRFWEMLLMPE